MQRKNRLELELGGKSRPLLFDFTFLDFLTDSVPLADLDALGATKPWKLIPLVTLAALQSGADFENSKEKLDLKTVTQWVQQVDPLLLNQVLEHFKDAMGFIGSAILGSAPESKAS